jgi:UDP-N-acetylmuramoyl-L-alanyl-D-glutamate--2,6-diaminopimelate ligase
MRAAMYQDRHILSQYIDLLDENQLIKHIDVDESLLERKVENLSYDSKDMGQNGMFICKGISFKPKYLKEAIENGGFCYVSQEDYDLRDGTGAIIVTDIRKAMAILANSFYNQAWRELNLVGITGTKGKSTVTYYIKHIIDHYMETLKCQPAAIVSGIDVDDGIILEESHLTTPEAITLHRHFHNAVDSGRRYLAMEVSSQALKYDRTYGVNFTVGCFLNIGEDHISPIEHCDFDDYFESKLKLLNQCTTACINMESDHVEEICNAVNPNSKIITFGTKEGSDVYGYRIISEEEGISFMVRTPLFTRMFNLGMTGLFNVDNALAAIAVCYSLDIPEDSIYQGLLKARVPGRMELFKGEKSGALVIVDYAHNRMSFERLYQSTIKEYPHRKIIAVFGCPGKKALARRQELAEIAGRYSSKIYITEEDAGEEDVMAICREIGFHVKTTGCPFEIETNREEAIRKAILEAGEDAVVLLTGKGRETRQKRGTEYVDCPSDVEFVNLYLV